MALSDGGPIYSRTKKHTMTSETKWNLYHKSKKYFINKKNSSAPQKNSFFETLNQQATTTMIRLTKLIFSPQIS